MSLEQRFQASQPQAGTFFCITVVAVSRATVACKQVLIYLFSLWLSWEHHPAPGAELGALGTVMLVAGRVPSPPSPALLSRPGACHARAHVSSLPLAQSDLSFLFPLCFHQPELTCQSLANSGQWWNCSLSLSPESGCWHLAPPCFLGPLVTLVSKRWRPSECLGEDQPGHRIHLRTGYDQVFENATKLPDISGFQAVSESTDAR